MANKTKDVLSDKYHQKAVADYHEKLTNIIVRIPSKQACGVDYKELIKSYLKIEAEKTGEKPKSMNEYILDLIEKDSGIAIHRGAKGLSANKE